MRMTKRTNLATLLNMKDYHYADGLERISFAGGMIRLDFFQYEDEQTSGAATAAPENAPEHALTQRLVMPPMGFLKAYEAMGQLVAQLEASGMITRRGAQAASQSPAPSSDLPPTPPSSPNFS